PIGLISADWGGTIVEAWTSGEALWKFPETRAALERLEEISDPERREGEVKQRLAEWWTNLDAGVGDGWTTPEGDDESWQTVELPATYASSGLGGFDGVVCFRRVVELPADQAGRAATLELGPIDDYDDVWINGEHVGATHDAGMWNRPRRYAVPADVLRAGRNVIAVRVLDTGGVGGINGRPEQLRLVVGGATTALAGTWRYATGRPVSDLPPRPEGVAIVPNTPSVLFNGMIAPLVPYTLAGAIWYQGESNRRNAERYRQLLPAMITDWRRQWGQGTFPFYYVQIAPFRYGGDSGQTALLREAQLMTMSVPNTGMAVTTDIGNPADIHPRNKQEVGRRLALWARARTYGQHDVVPSGPIYRDHAIVDGAARIRFDHLGGGLELRPADRSHFLIAGADRRFVRARAVVDGDEVVVSSPRVERPVAVRYGWEPASEPNLFNAAGLPASPFRTDDWSGPLPPVDNTDEMESFRDDDPAFVPLFDGRTLDGWANVNCAESTWRVEDGMIVCSGLPTGVLRTERQYENFVLEVEWRHLETRGNAGIFVWSDPLTARGQPFTRSVEVQVMVGSEADWYTSDGDVFPIHGATMVPENGRGGSRAFPTEKRVNPAPLWNHYRIECVDGAISLAVNGKVVTRGRQARPRKGYICLESEGSPVHFRNIRIKELPPAVPSLAPEMVADEAVGFEPLYNGVDFSGWRHGPEHDGHWRAANWRIDFDGEGADLWTERSFRDFELIADWRWTAEPRPVARPVILPSGEPDAGEDGAPRTVEVEDAGDSGIYLRGSSKSQVNIWCWPVGSGEVYGYRTDAAMPADVKAGVTPKVPADAPIGQWNRFVITMIGDRLTVELNGTVVIENARLPGVAGEGPIALQRHGDPIQFANLYIRELD
ncbi:MAG: family 16 glycoside hydrolase, partial [Planctomycetota bacterium]